MGKPNSEIDPLEALRTFIAKHGNQRKAAKALGISEPYMTDLVHGRRRVSDSLLEKLGLRRTIVR